MPRRDNQQNAYGNQNPNGAAYPAVPAGGSVYRYGPDGQPFDPRMAQMPYQGAQHYIPYAGDSNGAYDPQGYYQQANPYTQYAAAQAGYAPGAAYAAPAANRPVQAQTKPKRKKRFWIGIAIAVIAVIVAAVLVYSMFGTTKTKRGGELGQLDGKTPEEIQAEVDRIVQEGMFNISIASTIQFPNGASPGELRIENVPGNPYLMRVAIALDDTGQTVYTTDVIEQNHHIQSDVLDVALPAGTYNATATFTALDPETEEEVGQAAAKVVLQILS